MSKTENTCEVCGKCCDTRSRQCARCYRQGASARCGTVSNRLWARVNKNGPVPSHQPQLGACWEWMGGCTMSGYGEISVRGRKASTHRLSWELAHGVIPPGFQVLHHCDNRRCVRPDHLFLGTDVDNCHDKMAKNRHNAGERHGHAKLTWAIVHEIRARHSRGQPNVEIARLLGVGRKHVWEITSGKLWVEDADRVKLATSLLGDEGFELLRAAD